MTDWYKFFKQYVMGTFKIEIEAQGGHGADRIKKNNEVVNFEADGKNTPDAMAKKLIEDLRLQGTHIVSATLTHWPGTSTEVKDDLLTGIRRGNF